MKNVFDLKGFFGALLTGLAITVLILTIMVQYTQFKEAKKLSAFKQMPITDIFEASVYVPDFVVGDNPLLIYDTEKKQTFNGDFTVEIKTSDGDIMCRGYENNITYSRDDIISPERTSLVWFLGNQVPPDCYKDLEPGLSYMEVNYTIRVEGFPDRYYKIKSNFFTIFSTNDEKMIQKIIQNYTESTITE